MSYEARGFNQEKRNIMPQTNSQKSYDFKPVEFDAENIEPDAYPGQYEAKIDSVKVSKTSKDSYPMLIMEYKLDKALSDGEDCEKSVGAIVTDFVTFFPDKDAEGKPNRSGRMGKVRFREVCDALDLNYDIVPKKIQSKSDFDDFVKEVRGQKVTFWVTHKLDKSGENRIGISFKAPGGNAMGELSPIDEEEEEEEERTPARSSGKGGKASGKRR